MALLGPRYHQPRKRGSLGTQPYGLDHKPSRPLISQQESHISNHHPISTHSAGAVSTRASSPAGRRPWRDTHTHNATFPDDNTPPLPPQAPSHQHLPQPGKQAIPAESLPPGWQSLCLPRRRTATANPQGRAHNLHVFLAVPRRDGRRQKDP